MKLIIAIITILSIVLGCSKNNEIKKQYQHWDVVSVSGASTGVVNETINITVNWPYTNGCQMVDKFESIQEGFNYTIKAFGYSSGDVCTQDVGIKSTMYTFNPLKIGVYNLRFVIRNNTVIQHTITIN